MIVKLARESIYVWFTSYSKSKITSKSSILDHTLVYAIKPSYFNVKSIQSHCHYT